MKHVRLLALILAAFGALAGGLAWADLEGSVHDFSRSEWTDGDMCAACHTPHRSEPAATAPLWNPGADLSRRFGTDASPRTTPGNGTLSCVRCHDGTIATSTAAGVVIKGPQLATNYPGRFIGAHRTSDHPVGVPYPNIDSGYNASTSVVAKGIALPEGQVECTSCHDPHNEDGRDAMLVVSNRRSSLCLICHRK